LTIARGPCDCEISMETQAHATNAPPISPPDELQVQLADALVALELRLERLEAGARKLESHAGGMLFWRLRRTDPMVLTGLARRLQARLAAVKERSIRRHERTMLQNDARSTSSEQPDPDGP
jgi:hypothetical protein